MHPYAIQSARIIPGRCHSFTYSASSAPLHLFSFVSLMYRSALMQPSVDDDASRCMEALVHDCFQVRDYVLAV